ncbi:MAG: glycosyltransferase [Xanthobacteraceae bacterium]
MLRPRGGTGMLMQFLRLAAFAMISSNIELTIIIATRNGERVLPRTLDGYCGTIRPPVGWKLVIADDGSADSTSEIARSYGSHLPLQLLALPARGKSHALNSAIDAAEGRYVIFTDDDTIPGMYFLIAWLKAFHARTNYGMFGGSIDLVFETPPPEWMAEFPHTLAALFGERHLPEGPARWDDIFGGNMAIRRELFNQGFRFDESIGPGSGQGNRFGEDSEFCRRVADSGVRCWFAKEPIVQHVVRPHQLTRQAWINRAYLTGRGRAYLMLRRGPFRPPPVLSWGGRLRMLSPLARQRYESLLTYHLSRGFQDECARSSAEQQLGEPAIGPQPVA